MISTAHETQITGRISELKAITALIENGYEVAEPVIGETYDLLIQEKGGDKVYKVQVKTCRVRNDRDGAIVVEGTKNNGLPYTKDDCDYFVGVLGDDVYMFDCREISEYWVTNESINDRWRRLTN